MKPFNIVEIQFSDRTYYRAELHYAVAARELARKLDLTRRIEDKSAGQLQIVATGLFRGNELVKAWGSFDPLLSR